MKTNKQYVGKKLLILGGANQHLKFIEAAKKWGIYTIVTDYLPDSPCKKVCDESLNYDIRDINSIVNYCNNNNVDGVVSGFLDPCQIPYSKICNLLNLPCYGTYDQFYKFTNKKAFKSLCKKNGVNVITEYTEDDYYNHRIEYPVFIKPTDSRGSRGQTICYSPENVLSAIALAKKESSDGDCIIEKYMGDCDEVQITLFLIDGKIYIERTVDSNRGSIDLSLQNVVSCSISPSRYTDSYRKNAHPSVCRMINDLGIKNGPVFMQGFYKDDQFYFFDPGLRFPGVEYERIYEKVWGVNFAELLILYALDGHFPKGLLLPDEGEKMKGKVASVFFPVLRGGEIKTILGVEEYKSLSQTISFLTRYDELDVVPWSFDVNQRYAEIDILGSDINDVINSIKDFYRLVSVKDQWDKDMFFDKFNTNKLQNWYDIKNRKNDKISILIISDVDLIKSGCFNIPEAIVIAENALKRRAENLVIFPDKVSVVFNQETQNRINCLPAGVYKDNVYGMKWVSVFPNNPHVYGRQNVSAVILLSELQHGFPKVFMEGTLCSNLRTAATTAVAAKYLAKRTSKVLGFIGAGEQAKTHLMALLSVFPGIELCKVSSRTKESEFLFVKQMSRLYPSVKFEVCNSCYEEAARYSDIIVTAISGQEKILQGDWVSQGALYCHVGGLEDDYSVALKADKIVCDEWRVVKHRTQTISRMYKEGLIDDKDIYCDLPELVTGKKLGRTSESEFIYFNTVGMSYIDIMLANHMYKKVLSEGLGQAIVLQEKSMFDTEECFIYR